MSSNYFIEKFKSFQDYDAILWRKEKFTYSFGWEKGDIALWSNRSMLHAATAFNGDRKMFMITIFRRVILRRQRGQVIRCLSMMRMFRGSNPPWAILFFVNHFYTYQLNMYFLGEISKQYV